MSERTRGGCTCRIVGTSRKDCPMHGEPVSGERHDIEAAILDSCAAPTRSVFLEVVSGCEDVCNIPCEAAKHRLRSMDVTTANSIVASLPSGVSIVAHGIGDPSRFDWSESVFGEKDVQVCSMSSIPGKVRSFQRVLPMNVGEGHPITRGDYLMVVSNLCQWELAVVFARRLPLGSSLQIKSDTGNTEPPLPLHQAVEELEQLGLIIEATADHQRRCGGFARPLIRVDSTAERCTFRTCFNDTRERQGSVSDVIQAIGSPVVPTTCVQYCGDHYVWKILLRSSHTEQHAREATPHD